jgi:hypothetical protein
MSEEVIKNRQTGGNHYKVMGIQPIVFATVNRYDPSAFSTLKYISRHRRKHGKEDLQKAIDFVEIRLQLLRDEPELRFGPVAIQAIPLQEYAESNQLSELERAILFDLDTWARRVLVSVSDAMAARQIIQKIEHLSRVAYDDLSPGAK